MRNRDFPKGIDFFFMQAICDNIVTILFILFYFFCSTPYSERLKLKGSGTFFPKSLEVGKSPLLKLISIWVLRPSANIKLLMY